MRVAVGVAVLLWTLGASDASAQVGIRVPDAADDAVVIDGELDDWQGATFMRAPGFSWSILRAGDQFRFAFEVDDTRVIRNARPSTRTDDALVVAFRVPALRELAVYPGVSGRAAEVRNGTAVVRGSEAIESPRPGGYTLEASIPVAAVGGPDAISEAAIAVWMNDIDSESRQTVVITRVGGSGIPTENEYAPLLFARGASTALANFQAQQGFAARVPTLHVTAQIAGSRRPERVVVFGDTIVVVGDEFLEGTGFVYARVEMGCRETGATREIRAVEVDGDSNAELLLTVSNDTHRVVAYLFFDVSDRAVTRIGALEVARGDYVPDVSWDARRKRLHFALPRAREFPRTDWFCSEIDRLGLVAGTNLALADVQLEAGHFRLTEETARASARAPRRTDDPDAMAAMEALNQMQNVTTLSAGTGGVAAPPPVNDADPIAQQGALRASARAAAQLAPSARGRIVHVDIADDSRPEAIERIGRTIIVTGLGFRGGAGYFIHQIAVARDEDVLEMRVEDITGDSKAEVLLVVAQRIGDVTRNIVLVHRFVGSDFVRTLAVEVSRQQGTNAVVCAYQRVANGLRVGPATAQRWTRQTYPFEVTSQPTDGIDPIPLPWSGSPSRTYRWSGSRFVTN